MIDLHTHTFLSDGQLVASELARRAEVIGYRYLGITDHVDWSNIETVVAGVVRAARENNAHTRVKIVPGVELTHVPPQLIAELAGRARGLGAAYVVMHGESPVEPVAAGTNRAAILAGVDILAHPGLITREEVELAVEHKVLLEITTRGGHSLTNGHVARLAKEIGASLVLNTDSHTYNDLASREFARRVALGAGLTDDDFEVMQARALDLVTRVGYLSA